MTARISIAPAATRLSTGATSMSAHTRPRTRTRLHRPAVIDVEALAGKSFTRLTGGTYSPTVSTVHLDDGTTSRTDLISLNPSVDAYSIERAGAAPRGRSHYRLAEWQTGGTALSRECEPEIASILLESYPTVDIATLSDRLREAGHDLGRADLTEPQAIAATQAAIWHFSDAVGLDTRRHDLPLAASATIGAGIPTRHAALVTDQGISWRGTVSPEVPVHIAVDLHLAPRLGAYRLRLRHADTLTGLQFGLQASPDGQTWNDVSSSVIRPSINARHTADGLQLTKGLGIGATTSRSRHGGSAGHTHYRVRITSAERTQRIALDQLAFGLEGSSRHADHDHVIALYRYLLDRAAGASTRARGALLLGSRALGGDAEFTTLAVAAR